MNKNKRYTLADLDIYGYRLKKFPIVSKKGKVYNCQKNGQQNGVNLYTLIKNENSFANNYNDSMDELMEEGMDPDYIVDHIDSLTGEIIR